jgi:hypothetical protein
MDVVSDATNVQFPELPLANMQTRRDMGGIIGQLSVAVKRRRREGNIEHPTSNVER